MYIKATMCNILEKEEQLRKEREEGKPEKKPRKRTSKKARMAPANSAGEAIEKIIQEKKISSKINYEVLKNLNTATVSSEVTEIKEDISPTTSESIKRYFNVEFKLWNFCYLVFLDEDCRQHLV